MRVLLDTHVFLWAITDSDEASEIYLSVASVWEMLIQAGLGKLPLPAPPTEYLLKQMEQNRVLLLPIRPAHLMELQRLPPLHRDPIDRMLAAQARGENMSLLSADERIRQYGVETI